MDNLIAIMASIFILTVMFLNHADFIAITAIIALLGFLYYFYKTGTGTW